MTTAVCRRSGDCISLVEVRSRFSHGGSTVGREKYEREVYESLPRNAIPTLKGN